MGWTRGASPGGTLRREATPRLVVLECRLNRRGRNRAEATLNPVPPVNDAHAKGREGPHLILSPGAVHVAQHGVCSSELAIDGAVRGARQVYARATVHDLHTAIAVAPNRAP